MSCDIDEACHYIRTVLQQQCFIIGEKYVWNIQEVIWVSPAKRIYNAVWSDSNGEAGGIFKHKGREAFQARTLIWDFKKKNPLTAHEGFVTRVAMNK